MSDQIPDKLWRIYDKRKRYYITDWIYSEATAKKSVTEKVNDKCVRYFRTASNPMDLEVHEFSLSMVSNKPIGIFNPKHGKYCTPLEKLANRINES